MNPLAPLVTFAALEREAGRPLRWPGGRTGPVEGVDARLLARAIDWGMSDEHARNQIFNVANGDVFVWENVWPRVAEAFGMRVGEPAPVRLAEAMPPRAHEWANVVRRYGLRAPGLMDFVGDAFVYADLQWGHGRDEAGPSHLLSTIKLRQAGFAECIDSEEMLVQWIEWMQRERLIPAP